MAITILSNPWTPEVLWALLSVVVKAHSSTAVSSMEISDLGQQRSQTHLSNPLPNVC